ncbi:MAG: hypothetical protein P4L51_20085, partial [Puia sp.]|nr:hypothetical protein [Puia sp.]
MVIETFKTFLDTVVQFYSRYPTISRRDDLCAYQRTQNRNFPILFFTFTVGVVVMQVLGDLFMLLERIAYHKVMHIVLQQSTLDIILFVLVHYVARVGRWANLTENRKNDVVQSSARLRFLICGLIPASVLAMCPLFLADSENITESCGINWLLFTVAQLHLSAWSIGGLAYRIAVMGVYNVGFCYFAMRRCCFTILIPLRITVPTGLAAILIVGLDVFLKQNFLLKRGMKKQRNMYQNFMEQIQDPVLIMSRSELLFRNRAAGELGISDTNYAEKLLALTSSYGKSLLAEVSDTFEGQEDAPPPGSPKVVQQDRYQFEAAAGLPGRVVMKVSIIESAGLIAVGEKTVSVVMHDITVELERQAKKSEDKYKNMLLFSLSHELKTPLNIFQGFLGESKKYMHTEETKTLRREAKGA